MFVRDLAAQGGTLLFIGTKKQAADAICEEAQRCGMYYVNARWPGGMLTNFKTIKRSIARLISLEKMAEDGTFDLLPKKEAAALTKEIMDLQRNYGGIKTRKNWPWQCLSLILRKNTMRLWRQRNWEFRSLPLSIPTVTPMMRIISFQVMTMPQCHQIDFRCFGRCGVEGRQGEQMEDAQQPTVQASEEAVEAEA